MLIISPPSPASPHPKLQEHWPESQQTRMLLPLHPGSNLSSLSLSSPTCKMRSRTHKSLPSRPQRRFSGLDSYNYASEARLPVTLACSSPAICPQVNYGSLGIPSLFLLGFWGGLNELVVIVKQLEWFPIQ